MWNGEKLLCVIPCRSGSKGIPGKNLIPVNGYSLLERAVMFAESIAYIDNICVTTDDKQIASLFPQYSIVTEPGYLHSDRCRGIDVWKHALIEMEERNSDEYPLTIYLEPSSPIRDWVDVERCLLSLKNKSTAATVSKTQKKFCPEKQIIDTSDNVIHFTDKQVSHRQLVPEYYHLNGVCYAGRRKSIINDELFKDCARINVEHVTVNIDDPYDLQLAEWFLKLREVYHS